MSLKMVEIEQEMEKSWNFAPGGEEIEKNGKEWFSGTAFRSLRKHWGKDMHEKLSSSDLR